AEIAGLDDGAFLDPAAELAEDEGIGDETLLFQPPGGGRQRIARFDAEDAILGGGTGAVILRGEVKEAAPDHHKADDQQRQQAVENVDQAVARAAATPVPAVVHRNPVTAEGPEAASYHRCRGKLWRSTGKRQGAPRKPMRRAPDNGVENFSGPCA